MTLPNAPGTVGSVRVRLLPWRPRWRSTRDAGLDVPDPSSLLDLDDPVSAVIGFVLLLALLPLVMLGQLLGLRPWVLSVRTRDGVRHHAAVDGTREMLATRRYYRSLRA